MVHGLVMRSLWSQALSFALILYKVYDNKKMFSFWTFSVSFMSSYLYLSQPLSIFYFGWILFARPYRANLAFRHFGHYISQTLMYEIIISFLMCNLSLKKKVQLLMWIANTCITIKYLPSTGVKGDYFKVKALTKIRASQFCCNIFHSFVVGTLFKNVLNVRVERRR